MSRAYECDDLDCGSFDVSYLSIDVKKRDEIFERERQKNMHPSPDSVTFKDFEAGCDFPDRFTYYYGKWCYEYKKDEFNLEDESKLN